MSSSQATFEIPLKLTVFIIVSKPNRVEGIRVQIRNGQCYQQAAATTTIDNEPINRNEYTNFPIRILEQRLNGDNNMILRISRDNKFYCLFFIFFFFRSSASFIQSDGYLVGRRQRISRLHTG